MSVIKTLARRKVLAIHTAFDSAAESLLAEAQKIINQTSPVDQEFETKSREAALLKTIGFHNSKNVKEIEKKAQVVNLRASKTIQAQGIENLILAYKQNFPFYKFLTVDQLVHICMKYNLVFDDVERYIGEIPKKNIQELSHIPSLDLNPPNKPNEYNYQYSPALDFSLPNRYFLKVTHFGAMNDKQKAFWKNPPQVGKEQIKNILAYGLNNERLRELSNRLGCPIDWGNAINVTAEVTTEDFSKKLYIAAPKSMFDSSIIPSPIKKVIGTWNTDPVVFRRCKGGIQVITKWGLEAGDELLVNEIEN